jgi:hypothetical protein
MSSPDTFPGCKEETVPESDATSPGDSSDTGKSGLPEVMDSPEFVEPANWPDAVAVACRGTRLYLGEQLACQGTRRGGRSVGERHVLASSRRHHLARHSRNRAVIAGLGSSDVAAYATRVAFFASFLRANPLRDRVFNCRARASHRAEMTVRFFSLLKRSSDMEGMCVLSGTERMMDGAQAGRTRREACWVMWGRFSAYAKYCGSITACPQSLRIFLRHCH